jgi:carboxyl-terminal processing protease
MALIMTVRVNRDLYWLALALAGIALMPGPALGQTVEGVWRSRGYGWIVETGPPLQVYHEAGDLCWPEPDPALAGALAAAVLRPDGTAVFSDGEDDQSTGYVFDRLPDLPMGCRTPAVGNAASVRAVADLMSAWYPGFEGRKVDFAARRRAVLSGLNDEVTRERAVSALRALLTGLDDPHLELDAEVDGEDQGLVQSQGPTLDRVHARPGDRPERSWLIAWRDGVEQRILAGQGHAAANDRVFWGVNDGIGYLTILTMGGFDPEDDESFGPLDAALDEAMVAFAGARAVIVDVSNNRGGYDLVSRRIAGRFADRPRFAWAKRAWNSGEHAQPVEVRPVQGPRYLGTVVLLTSDITVSAGESFTLAMRALPSVTHVGTRTRGALSDQAPVTLPNGWRFAMPGELYTDPDGRNLEGVGIVPQRRLDLYPPDRLDRGHAEAVLSLMAELRR